MRSANWDSFMCRRTFSAFLLLSIIFTWSGDWPGAPNRSPSTFLRTFSTTTCWLWRGNFSRNACRSESETSVLLVLYAIGTTF
ncbi:Uncharacterised protein [uncultured archaeon]|nr:Uncharacterised protein [uncultured archaeon]